MQQNWIYLKIGKKDILLVNVHLVYPLENYAQRGSSSSITASSAITVRYAGRDMKH